MRADHTVIAKRGNDGAFGQFGDAQADDQPEDEDAVHDAVTEFRLAGEVFIDMKRLGVHGEGGKQDVVHFGDGASERVFEALADFQVFEVFAGHGDSILDFRFAVGERAE